MKKNFKFFAVAMMAVALAAFAGCKKDDPEPEPETKPFEKGELTIDFTTDTASCAALLDQIHMVAGESGMGTNMIGNSRFAAKLAVVMDGDTAFYPISTDNPAGLKQKIVFTEVPAAIQVLLMVSQNAPEKGGEYAFYYNADISYDLLRTDGTVMGHDAASTVYAANEIGETLTFLSAISPVELASFAVATPVE